MDITGTYQHEADANIANFSQILGNDYIGMIGMSNLKLKITKNNGGLQFKTIEADGTQKTVSFIFDENYDEITPSGAVLKNATSLMDNYLITVSITKDGEIFKRIYKFTEDGFILTIGMIGSNLTAIRYFTKINQLSSLIKNVALYGTAAVVSGGLGIVAAPAVLGAVGFTSVGIAAGSFAASMMSALGGGFTTAGGIVATCQSVGALGTVLGSTAATATAAGAGTALGVTGTAIVDKITRR